jgi:hypothetical protein
MSKEFNVRKNMKERPILKGNPGRHALVGGRKGFT